MAEPKRVYLHIGAPKTGTTFLQQVLARNRDALGEAGVLYPRVGREAHHSAVWSVRKTFQGTDSGAKFARHWSRLVNEVDEWQGPTVVVSSELFCFSRGGKITEILSGFPGAEVHVVYTARDLMRQVPAVWQEQVKNRQTTRYRDFLDDVLGGRSTDLTQLFWGAQDVRAVLARWSKTLEPHRVHVVTAPPAGSPPGLLWQRFAAVIGVDPDAFFSEIPPANRSLSITAAEALRRYNERYAADLPILEYRRMVRRQLDPAFAATLDDSARLPLTPAQQAAIVALSERMVKRVRRAGYDVVGSLDELLPTGVSESQASSIGPDDISDSEVMEALLKVLDHLLRGPR